MSQLTVCQSKHLNIALLAACSILAAMLFVVHAVQEASAATANVESIRRAAEQGDAVAQHSLGVMYWEGQDVIQNDRQAVEWFRRAAEQGNVNAQYNLGVMYGMGGSGVAKDDRLAAEWFRRAAEQGHFAAQRMLANLLGESAPVDPVGQLRQAAEQGNVNAQFNLGLMYRVGSGVAQDDRPAAEWFRRAAEQGHVEAQWYLGSMYLHGQGVAQDDRLAVEWVRRAAEQGIADAQYTLGFMYAHGRGVAQNDGQAIHWSRGPAGQGHSYAQQLLAALSARQQSTPTAQPQATQAAHVATAPAEQSVAHSPLTAADGKPTITAHRASFVNGTVQLELRVLAPGKTIEAVRIDNLGGVPSLWRSDGRDGAAPLSVSQGGAHLSTGSMPMIFNPGNTEALLSLSLRDNGAFAGKSTDFRVTVFFTGGDRALYEMKAGDFPTTAPVQAAREAPPSPAPTVASTSTPASPPVVAPPARPAATPAFASTATPTVTPVGLLAGIAAIVNAIFVAFFVYRKRLLDKAAEGDAQAQFAVYKMYKGKQDKLDLAMHFLSQSAEQGYADAQSEKNAVQGQHAAKQNVAEYKVELSGSDAKRESATTYPGGGDGATSNKDIQELLEKAESGDTEAMLELAYALHKKGNYNPEDILFWTGEAASLGNARAQFELSEIYSGKDDSEAFKWMEKSARNGYTEAKNSLAIRYLTGTGTVQDNKQAFYWMEQASNDGNARARRKLGIFYIEGTGVSSDREKGLSLLREAVSLGDDQAKGLLEGIYAPSSVKKMKKARIIMVVGGCIGAILGMGTGHFIVALILAFFGLGLGPFMAATKDHFLLILPHIVRDRVKAEGLLDGLKSVLIGYIILGPFMLGWALIKSPFTAIADLIDLRDESKQADK